MAYPKYVNICGEKVPINTSWKTALKCFNVIDDIDISDTERTLAILYLLYGFIPKEHVEEYLKKAQLFLQCGETRKQQSEKVHDMDFEFDRKYINASFMSDYHIDLEATLDMHFWQYCELIQGLKEDSILSRVRYLRTVSLKDYAPKDRDKIRKAKSAVALPQRKTKEQKEAEERFEALMRGDVIDG